MKNKRRVSPMKGKKFSPEHLEERRQRRAERKAQRKEWLKLYDEQKKAQEEGVKVRAVYQTFMQDPKWMTHINKERLVKTLTEIIQEEKDLAVSLERAGRNKPTDDFDYKTATNDELNKRIKKGHEQTALLIASYRKSARLYELEYLLSLFAPKDAAQRWFYGEQKEVHADFSMYCRDN